MRGTIESINERKIKSGKRKGAPYHIVEIDGTGYFAWEANLIEGLSENGLVEFEFEDGEYPKLTSINMCPEGTPPPQKQVSKYDDTKIWNTCVMCAKDIVVALIHANASVGNKDITNEQIEKTTIDFALAFYKASENGVVEEEPDPEADIPMDFEEKPPPEAGTTFDSLNSQIINTKWENKEELAGWWANMQGSMLKMTEDERKQLIKTYSSELGKIK